MNGPGPQLPVVKTPIHRFVLTEITTHATAEVASRLHFRFKVLAAVAPNGVEEAITVWNLRRMKGLAETAADYLAQLVDEPNGRGKAPKLAVLRRRIPPLFPDALRDRTERVRTSHEVVNRLCSFTVNQTEHRPYKNEEGGTRRNAEFAVTARNLVLLGFGSFNYFCTKIFMYRLRPQKSCK